MSEEKQPKIIIDEDWKSQVQAEKEALKATEEKPAAPAGGAPTGDQPEQGELPPLPPASLAGLVSMLATQATVLLQEASDPSAQQRQSLLNHAKHFIDMLGVIQEKTSGNLSSEEAMMLENLLHELRMGFVSVRGR